MCKEELQEGPGTFTESWLDLGVEMRSWLEEEHCRQRDLVEVEEYVMFKSNPEFHWLKEFSSQGLGGTEEFSFTSCGSRTPLEACT